MTDRHCTLLLLILLACIAYSLRVIGAHSSVMFTQDTHLVRQSLELGQGLLAPSADGSAIPTGFKYPLTLTSYLTGVYGIFFAFGRASGLFESLAAFRNFLFTNREAAYVLAVFALSVISVLLIPALYFVQRRLKASHSGWLAAGLAAFNVLLVHFGHQPRPHVAYATIAFGATALLVFASYRAGGWRVLIAATVCSALTVGALQSGILIVVPYVLTLVLRPFSQGKYDWRELISTQSLCSIVLFVAACLVLYPDFVLEYGRVIIDFASGENPRFLLGGDSHSISLAMFDTANVPQFISRLQTYHPLLTILLPPSVLYFLFAFRRRYRLLLVSLPFPLMNLMVWSVYVGTFPRITAVLVPFIILASAFLIEDAANWLAGKFGIGIRLLRTVVFSLILLPTLATSARLVWVTAQPDTRSLAVNWINDSIPEGESILLNFALTTLLPTDDAIARQGKDFPGSVGTQWQWLHAQDDIDEPRYNIFNVVYWNSLDENDSARDQFVEQTGIRYLLVRSQVSLTSVEDMVSFAQAKGKLVQSFCPASDTFVAELPDDLFYQAWRQVWLLQKPGPFVAIYDLDQASNDTPIERFCQTSA